MNRRFMLTAVGCLVAFLAVAAGPTDNLRADYRNAVYTNGLGSAHQNNVALGIGAGYRWTSAPTAANWHSSIGVPITAVSANKFLGEPLTPPANWDGNEPTITPDTGGIAVWVDFAHAVFTAQAGPIEVKWRLSNGSYLTENSVVSPSPSKRPVRLYWTHQRPPYIYDQTTFKPLQNAGPTVSFGSNYKVHLYGTRDIKVLYASGGKDGMYVDTDGTEQYYEQNDGNGYVRLDGGELQALEGSRGTFLIIYSRLDETLNERVMLAYELVEVMEPMQTQINVGIGDQLEPLTRTFNTTNLFPMVTRGMTDDADQDEIYVYQHMAGKQKNYLWAIRDSSENPWKIEVYWRAKEELDVVWPFEVDIYSATWKDENAQLYLRNPEGHENGDVEAEPKVLVPASVTVEAMDYQVPRRHVHVENGAFYTDYAGDDAYALLKYTAGDTVWFQTVRSVLHTDSEYDRAVLAEEIVAPKEYRWDKAEDGFFYPGWIRRDFRSKDPHYPIVDAYNPVPYRFPTEWAPTNSLNSQIFPVNIGELEVWWSKLGNLTGEIRKGSGHVEKLSTPIFFPTEAYIYTIMAPDNGKEWDNVTPQIVIASGQGSAGWSLNDTVGGYSYDDVRVYYPEWDEWYWETTKASKALHLDIYGWNVSETADHPYVGYFTTTVPGSGENKRFTVENWMAFLEYGQDEGFEGYRGRDIVRGVPWVSFYTIDAEGGVSGTPHFSLRVDGNANIWVNGEKKTAFTEIPNPLFNRGTCQYYNISSYTYANRSFHVALSCYDGKFTYYVNGMPVAEFTAEEGQTVVGGDRLVIFPRDENYDTTFYVSEFHGDWRMFRLWSEARSHEQIYKNRYLQLDPVKEMLLQYGDQEFVDDRTVSEDGALVQNTLVDSSSRRSHASYGFFSGIVEERIGDDVSYNEINGEAYRWIRQSTTYSAIPIPVEGRTFPSGARIYRQPDPEQPGYNPNEEHAFMVGNVAYALRCDLNKMSYTGGEFSSLPYVLVQHADPDNPKRFVMTALRVVPENDMYRFRTFLDAGLKIQSVSPLNRLQPANMQKFISGPLYADTQECFKDRKNWYWAQQAGNDGGSTNYVFEFSYPHQEQFDYPNGDAPEVGTAIGFMQGYTGRDDFYLSIDYWGNIDMSGEYDCFATTTDFIGRAAGDDPSTPVDYTFIVNWPADVKGLYVNDTLIDEKNELPAIDGQLSVKVVYQQSSAVNGRPSVKLIDPTRIRYGSLVDLPEDVRNYRDAGTDKTKFNDLPPLLRDRLVWNPEAKHDLDNGDTRELELSGTIIREISFTYAWLNVMDMRSKDVLTNPETFAGGDNPDWATAINSLPGEPFEIEDDTIPFDSLALTTTGQGAGYVTLVMNNSTNESMVAKSEVVTMYVIKVVPELYSGDLHVILSDNPLDQQVNMKYTADFGGKPEQWEFEWKYCDPVNGKPNSDSNQWFAVANSSPGSEMLDWISVGDAGIFGLSDHYVKCRYRAKPGTDAYELVGDKWSKWSSEGLAEGWIKRVLKAINPFEQRIRDYRNTAITTDLTMIQQAGEPYNGDIPLNLEKLNESGLISIYETVLRQARKLTIDASDDPVTDTLALALQMAAGRIAELYMVLGNEALADAMNPTVDLGNNSPVDDGAESSIFPFMNQCENLLDEELALLRGRDLSMDYERAWSENVEPWKHPYYNRLQWNFTHDVMGGHVAYVLNYGIKDLVGNPSNTKEDPTKPDGTIDVYDAQKLYPQGHGDAYGHYLSAEKGYYSLLRHPAFGWKPQIESILAGQVDITMSYFHEKRFALAAQAKAKTAAKIVAATYRQNYTANIEDPWMEAEDDELYRAWGTDEWATRGHLGAYYDWLTLNALLPTREPEDRTLVKMLDRESTYELGSIASAAKTIQSTADYADVGLNPLGLADNAIPFDISPAEIDAGKTHFEQIYDRAEKAVTVAHDIFRRAKKSANALRDQSENAEFDHLVADEEAAIDRRLKEIYGYPYSDDIGVGKIYPQGYSGPDLLHYDYIETYDLDKSGHEFGRYYDVLVNDYQLITTNCVGTFTSDAERLEADYGPLGNLVAGAITWWQQYMPGLAEQIDPYLAYGGISSSTNYLTLPVTIIDTGADHLDGTVEYNFSVAAWTNACFYASYYVSAYGFTPKPASYKGQRRAEGELQIALTGYAAQLAEIEQEAKNLEAASAKLMGLIDELTTKDYNEQMGYVTEAAAAEVQAYNDAVKQNAAAVEKTLNSLKDIKNIIAEVATEALPKVVGMASDISSLGRAALLAVKQAAHELINNQIKQQQDIIAKAETEAEKLQKQLNERFSTYQANEERQKKIAEINEQMPVFKAALAKLEVTFNTANATRMKYAKLKAEGDELQNERKRIRIQWAADLSQKRYRNMMYQILRDDELQRYNEAFELAAKYTFLAAKAYDYETGLLMSDSSAASGSQFLSEIVRSRALGRFAEDGAPLGGGSLGDPGLADILYRMNANWAVLRTRLGFNNAQQDIDSFSLRQDLFGRSAGADGDTAWRNDLAACWVDDLKTHPAFAAHCQPFDPMQDAEPGFAIPFSTVVAARKDLFGNDLQGGSTAYSSTYFATKLRGVGVWIETDGTASIPKRPEVYLVPSGLDYMRVPMKSSSSAVVATRMWQVVDQTIPVPYSLSDTDWSSADWGALKDVCANEMCTVRRHPAIRAQTGASFSEDSLTYNARLIGRSVWNDQWWIFIPAASINAYNARSRTMFLDSVKDIHLNLKTYSLSGN